jgi:hypothetical protein
MNRDVDQHDRLIGSAQSISFGGSLFFVLIGACNYTDCLICFFKRL